jgi:transposase-like protein
VGRGWSSYLRDVGLASSTAHRWLQQYDPTEQKKIEKPEPTPEQIERKHEAQERIQAHIEEDRQIKADARVYVSDDVGTLIDEARQSIKASEEVKHLALDGDIENLAQGNIFQVIDRYVYSFDGVSRQLEAVQNLIKKLRLMATELHAAS